MPPLLQQVEDDPFTPQLQPVDHDPFNPSPADVASMTHYPAAPNPARPIIDAVKAFAGGGLQGVANEQGVNTPEWSQRLGAVLSSPEANAALGVMTPLGKVGNIETVSSTAVKIGDKTYVGRNHAAALDQAQESLNLPWDQFKPLLNQAEDGFMTSHGRFVGREEANDLAERANQINKASPFYTAGSLASESKLTQPPAITAFHGSPHDFGAFDLSKIGTGEGAQSYGHGLYFAENEGTAQSYRDALQGQNTNWNSADEIAGHFLNLAGGNRNGAAGLLASFMSRPTAKLQYNLTALGDARDLLKSSAEIAPPKGTGKMYQVSINADPEHFLDWDKPLSEQSPKVREALTDKMGLDPKHGDLSGHALMDRITNEVVPYGQATNENISNSLRAAGIPGIKYLDQGSRFAGNGTRNYVVFDDKLVSIMKKYGIAGLGALPAMGAYHFQTAPTDGDPFAQ